MIDIRKNKKTVDWLFEAYENTDPRGGVWSDGFEVRVKDNGMAYHSKERINLLLSHKMDIPYFWKKAVKFNPAFAICGRDNKDLSIDEINDATRDGMHLQSKIVNHMIENMKPTGIGSFQIFAKYNMLEIGPGYGGMMKHFKKVTPNVKWHGMDVNCLFKHPRLYKTDGFNIPEKAKNKNIDIVYSMNVFQHLSRYQRTCYYEQIYDLLPEGGMFVFGMFVNDESRDQVKIAENKWLFGNRDDEENPFTVFYSQLTEVDNHADTVKELEEIGYTLLGTEILGAHYGVFLIAKNN